MYNISKVIDKIVRIDIVTDSKILVVRDNALECYVDDTIIWSYTFRSNHIPITKYFMNDKDCLVAFDTILYRFHYDKFLFEKFLELGFYPTCQHFKKLIGHNFGKIYAYNLQTNKNDLEINDYDGGYLLIRNNIIQLNFPKRNFLTCHPLSTGEEKWRLDFDALLGVSDAALYGDIFEHQGRIYFYLSNALSSAKSMYCVLVETGEVIAKIAGFGGFRVQKVKDILYDMRGYTLQMLHLDSLEMTKRDFSTILQPLDWQSNGTDKFLVKEDKIYFIGQARKDNIMLVEVDMNTEQIISKTDIGSNQFLVHEIRAEGNRIYLLKDNRELLIYEK